MDGPGGYRADFQQPEDNSLDPDFNNGADQYATDHGSWTEPFSYSENNVPGVECGSYLEGFPSHGDVQQNDQDYSADQGACHSDFANAVHYPQAHKIPFFHGDRQPQDGTWNAIAERYDPSHQNTEPMLSNTYSISSSQQPLFGDHDQLIPPPSSERSNDAFVDFGASAWQSQDTYPTTPHGNAHPGSLLSNECVEYYTREANQDGDLTGEALSQPFVGIDPLNNNSSSPVCQRPNPAVGGDPWSSMNQINERPEESSPRFDHWVHVATSYEASRTSNPSGNTSNSLWLITKSTTDSDGQDWGQNSAYTIRPSSHLGSNLSPGLSNLRHPAEYSNMKFMPNENATIALPIRLHASTPAQNNPISAGPQRNPRTKSSRNNRLSVAPYPPPRFGSASPAGSTASDSFRCPLCSAEFSGAYGRGNWGRHNRDKHNDVVKAYPCLDADCTKIFARTDARTKHVRKHHHHVAVRQPMV